MYKTVKENYPAGQLAEIDYGWKFFYCNKFLDIKYLEFGYVPFEIIKDLEASYVELIENRESKSSDCLIMRTTKFLVFIKGANTRFTDK